MIMPIEFDADKDAANILKHGVSLAFAEQVLGDIDALVVLDVRHDYGEDRFITYGAVEGRVWVCVTTARGAAWRVISVRKANDRETKRYQATPR